MFLSSRYLPCRRAVYGLLSALVIPSVLALAYSRSRDSSAVVQNLSTSVPIGTTNHGDPRMLCTPTGWTDVVTFLLANYVAHPATVKSAPGEPTLRSYVALATALIYPTSGIIRGLQAVSRRAHSSSSPLQPAKKAGALCTIVRKRVWQPRSGDVVRVFTESAVSRCGEMWREYVKSMPQTIASASPFLAKVVDC